MAENGFANRSPASSPGSRSYNRSSSAGSNSLYDKKPKKPALNLKTPPERTVDRKGGDVFNDPDFVKLMECGEIDLGGSIGKIEVCASDIRTGKKLGGGQYGNVYQCSVASHPKLKFAYKDICLETSDDKKKSIISELEVTKKVKGCEFAVQTYCQITSGINLWLVMELMDLSANDLIEECEKREPKLYIPESVVKTVSYSCIKCLSYLKSLDLMHRDVKPSNILIRMQSGEVKLGDFGICGKLVNSIAKSKIYQFNYLAPERINLGPSMASPVTPTPGAGGGGGLGVDTSRKREGYTVKSDIWAVGVTTYELVSLQHPFYAKNQIFATWRNIVENPHMDLADKTKVSDDLNDFVNQCLDKEPEKRPGYTELLEHNFIKSFDPVANPQQVKKFCQTLFEKTDEE